MSVVLISHPDCALHDMGRLHPESPARLSAISDRLVVEDLAGRMTYHEAPLATREQLCRAHDADYVEHIFAASPQQGLSWLDPDTCMNPYSLNAALRAAGAGVLGVDLVMNGEADAVFCSVRPPGHHAGRAQAMGFCIFNNIAVAAAHALAHYRLDRIAIIDFDVHHGNGTEDIFRDDERVLFCSTFQHPFYPHVGAGTRSPHIVNVPLPAGSNGRAFRAAVEEQWLPALRAQRPQLLLISAGFDAHMEDELAGLALVEDDYAWVTTEVRALARSCCDGRIVSMLEGGYALRALGRSVAAHLRALL